MRLWLWSPECERFMYGAQPRRVDRVDANEREQRTARAVMMMRSVQPLRRRRLPKQIWPKSIETEYAKALVGLLDRGRQYLEPLEQELQLLVAAGSAARHDADEARRARELIDKARDQLAASTRPDDVEALARLFGQRTQTYQRIQLGRQVRAALGADVFASDHRINTLLDHFVQENTALIRTIPHDVLDEVQQLVSRGFTSGTSHRDLAAQIDERFDVGESRARLIARDQVGKLYGQTNAYRQQDLGIESFIWRTAGDERVRDEHEVLDGEEFRYDDPPDEGLPGEPIQCRCYAEPVFSGVLAAASDEES